MSKVKVVHGYEGYKEEQEQLMKEGIYITIPDLAKAHELYRWYLEDYNNNNEHHRPKATTFKEFLLDDYSDEIETLY